tara:strand:+ start:1639 stop:1920 length:282 start_codon:yes stop_codon:yes gene_type:complete
MTETAPAIAEPDYEAEAAEFNSLLASLDHDPDMKRVVLTVLAGAAARASSSTLPRGHGPIDGGSRSTWYAHGRFDANAAIRELHSEISGEVSA